MKILVADDDAVNRKYLRVLLTHERHTVVECEDGIAALCYLEENPCDAVISDVLMLRMDGYRLCYEIRKNEKLKNTPIILYTASYLSDADEKAALAMGADRFIRKPAIPEMIVKTLHDLIATRPAFNDAPPHEPKNSSALREYSEALVRKLEETNAQLAAANEALGESEERLRLAASAGNVGIWEWNPATDRLVWSDQQKIAFGWQPDKQEITLQTYLDTIHEEDRQRVEASLRSALAERTAYEAEYRVVWLDGSVHWIADKGRGDYDAAGACPRMRGITLDVTRRKEADEALRKSEARFREMADSAPVMIWISRGDGSCIYLNKQWHDFTGQSDATGLGFGWLDAVSPEDRERVNQEFRNAIERRSELRMEYRLRRRDGVYRWVIDTAQPRIGQSGEFFGFIGSVIDITDRKLAEEERQSVLERIRFLHEIGAAINSSLNLQTILETLLEKIDRFIPYPSATAVRLLNKKTGRLAALACHNLDAEDWKNYFDVTPIGRAKDVLESKTPVIVRNLLADAETANPSVYRRLGVVSLIAVPLIIEGEALGILNFFTTEEREFTFEEIEFLMTLAGQAAVAIHNARLYEQSQSHLKRIEALREIDRAITSTLDLHSVLHVLLEKIEIFLPYPAATTIRLFNRTTNKFDNTACRNIDENEWRARIGQGTGNLSGQVLETKRPVIVANIQEDAQRSASPFYRRYGFVSYLGVPLLAKDEVLGILGFYTKSPHDFSEEETDALLTLAGQAAIAISHAQLYEEIERSRRALETTNLSLERSLKQLDSLYTALSPVATGASTREIMAGIIDRLVEATGADAALIRAWEPQSNTYSVVGHKGYSEEFLERLRRFPPGGSADWVIRHGEPIVAPDIAAEPRFRGKMQLAFGFRSAAMLPLLAQDNVRGIVQVSSRNLGHFHDEHKDHLSAIARQLSIAMENRELFDKVKASRDELERANTALTERNRMLSALHAVAAASSQSLNLDLVLSSAIQKVTDIFHFDATRIHLCETPLGELRLKAAFENDPGRFSLARSFKIGQGVVGKVAESGEKIIFSDIQTDPRYKNLSRTKTSGQHGYHFFAVFPIKGKTATLGTVTCVGTSRRDLTASEVQLLEAISDQLAVAIENSELYDDVRLKVEELQRNTAELEQANKVKDDFLGVVSHELRTPINVIMGYTSLFKDGFFGAVKPEQEDALAKIARESKSLLAMINSVLHATTLDTGKLSLESEEFNLESLLEELRANYAVTAPQQLSLHWNYPAGLPPLKTDRGKLKQILDNLIGNAIKFTEKGSVTVSARGIFGPLQCANGASICSQSSALGPQRSWLEFKVTDTGAGIPSDRLELIFDKFYQVDSSETRRFGGVGIGLYIARKFAELLGGKITVESTERSGSTFTLTLPCQAGAESFSGLAADSPPAS